MKRGGPKFCFVCRRQIKLTEGTYYVGHLVHKKKCRTLAPLLLKCKKNDKGESEIPVVV